MQLLLKQLFYPKCAQFPKSIQFPGPNYWAQLLGPAVQAKDPEICFVENGNNLLTIYEKKLIFWEIKAN